MIRLSFSLPDPSSPWQRTWENAEKAHPASIPEIDLRYKYFNVNAEMTVNEVEVISKRRFVTLVDLALSIRHAGKRIAAAQDAAIGFTESSEVIYMRHADDYVSVTSSKHSWQAMAERVELIEAFHSFLREAHSCLVSKIPELATNPTIRTFNEE